MSKNNSSKYIQLFLTFLKIGAFTFGGGYAMIPLISREVCVRRRWLSEEDILEVVAIAESTPGPIAVNSATFVGYRTAGFWGAFLATLGVVLPSFLIITAISFVLSEFRDIKAVRYAFWGIRAGVLALILKALCSMYQACPKSIIFYIISAGAFIFTAFLGVNAIFVIIGCALAGLIYSLAAKRRADR